MTAAFRVLVTPAFERLYRKLEKLQPDLPTIFAQALTILATDPQNRARRVAIRKLVNVNPGEGQFRLRLSRWRFRYDVSQRDVVLHYCGLRREDTYRQKSTRIECIGRGSALEAFDFEFADFAGGGR